MSDKIRGSKTRTFNFNVTTTPLLLSPADPRRTNVLIYNNGSVAVYVLGSQTQTTSDGIPIAAAGSYSNDSTTADIFIVSGTTGQNIRVQVDSD